MGEIPEEGLLCGLGLVEKLDALLGPEIGAIPGRREPGIVTRDLFAIEVEAAARHPAGLIPKMNPSQFEVETAEESPGSGIDRGGVSHMPFSRDGGQVAGFAEDLCNRVAVVAQGTSVTGDALVGRHPAYSGLVRVEAGQQRGPGRAAAPGVVELGELRAAFGEGVEVRGGNLTPIASDIGESHVVDHDQDDVGALLCGERKREASKKDAEDGVESHWNNGERGRPSVGLRSKESFSAGNPRGSAQGARALWLTWAWRSGPRGIRGGLVPERLVQPLINLADAFLKAVHSAELLLHPVLLPGLFVSDKDGSQGGGKDSHEDHSANDQHDGQDLASHRGGVVNISEPAGHQGGETPPKALGETTVSILDPLEGHEEQGSPEHRDEGIHQGSLQEFDIHDAGEVVHSPPDEEKHPQCPDGAQDPDRPENPPGVDPMHAS